MRKFPQSSGSVVLLISPHDALGPVSIIASAPASITMPNLYRLECLHEWFPTFAKIIKPMFEYRDGAVWFDASRPGLGIELDHEGAAENRVDPVSDEAARNRLGGKRAVAHCWGIIMAAHPAKVCQKCAVTRRTQVAIGGLAQ